MMKLFRKKEGHGPDYLFLSSFLIIVVFGLIILSSASSDLGKIKFNDTYYYVKHQIFYGLGFGLFGFLTALFLYYRYWQKWAGVIFILCFISLLLVFTPLGIRHSGADRWIDLHFFSFQPAELIKFGFIIYLAAWLSSGDRRSEARKTSLLRGYLPFLGLCALVAVPLFLQPSTTTVIIIISSALIVYFVAGGRFIYIVSTIILGMAILAGLIYFTPYRFERIASFVGHYTNSESVNLKETGYQLNQSLIAIGSGGLNGVGLGKSTAKFRSLPEAIGDSIFAVAAEELGFLGAVLLIILFGILFIRGFTIGKNSRDQFARLVTIGFISVIAIQTLVNIASISGLSPLTGVPLPFVSYGGTSLAVFLTMVGTIVNISRYTE